MVPKFRYHEDILEAENSFNVRVEREEHKLRFEEQRLANALLEQENIDLKETIIHLEHELRRKDEEKGRR